MRTCIVCGCTDTMACSLGCHWVKVYSKNRGLCSECPEPVKSLKFTPAMKKRHKELAAKRARIDAHRRQMLHHAAMAQASYDQAVADLRSFHVDTGAKYLS